jgi:hypothetical protein
MASAEEIAAKKQARAKQMAIQQAITAMPAQAAMLKAKAAVAKAGAGTPPGQLPAEGGQPLQQQLAA